MTQEHAAPKTARPNSMLYEVCSLCGGTSWISSEQSCFACQKLSVVPIGVTAVQLERIAKLDTLRQEAGISAAMLRDGRAAAFGDLLAAAQLVLAGLNARIDDAVANGKPVPVFDGIADLHSAIAKATKSGETGV